MVGVGEEQNQPFQDSVLIGHVRQSRALNEGTAAVLRQLVGVQEPVTTPMPRPFCLWGIVPHVSGAAC